MSINDNARSYKLEEKINVRTKSGATKEEWKEIKGITMAMYPISEALINNSVKLSKCSYIGLTDLKEIKSNFHRIREKNKIYSIMECKVIGRYTQLFLKELVNV